MVAWYRNPTGGTQAVAVPYGPVGGQTTVYPDVVVFRMIDGAVRVDIIDTHRPDHGDTAPKWSALAAWARRVNAGEFDIDDTLDGLGRRPRLGRVWAVINDRDDLLFVDLLEDGIGEQLGTIAETGAGV